MDSPQDKQKMYEQVLREIQNLVLTPTEVNIDRGQEAQRRLNEIRLLVKSALK